MLGNAPLILRDDMRRHWGDIPLIVCAESRYIGPDSTYMYNQIIPYKDRIYLKDLRNEYNMTFLAARAFIPESVQLLRRMIPKMKSLLLIGDQTDRDIDYDQQLSELINTEYTDINYKFLSAAAWSRTSCWIHCDKWFRRKPVFCSLHGSTNECLRAICL